MKTNKGFTLIELLAVIVILAIIALIATPTILGVIETARQGAAKSSALGYIDAVEKQIAIDMVADTTVVTIPANGQIDVTSITGLTLKGAKPSKGQINVNTNSGIVESANLAVEMNGKHYCVSYTQSATPTVATMASADAACPAA